MAVVPLPFDGGNTGRAGLDLGDAVVGRIVVCNVYKEGYTMPEFNAVENTLFIPMLGRIYASEHFQNILYDEKALSLKDALPKVWWKQVPRTNTPCWLLLPVPPIWTDLSGTSSAANQTA